MNELYYCPNCGAELEVMTGCGTLDYFCNKCKKIISKKKILTKEQLNDRDIDESNNKFEK